jgi:hypothetical protein
MQQLCKPQYRMFDRLRRFVLMAMLSTFAPAMFAQARASQDAHAQAATTNTPSLTAAQQEEFARAESAAERILTRAEFQRPEPTLWDKFKTKVGEILIRFFLGVDRVTTKSPWVGRALEWLLFVAAAVGVLVWVLRTVQRQRLRVALASEPAKRTAWDQETEDWRRLAEREAAKGAWREAIHALYWAAIVHLEQRRAWRHNPSRTPREYVRLLKTGSEEQRELRNLTNALEQSWYGQREPDELEFSEARESFDRLSADRHPQGAVAGGNG